VRVLSVPCLELFLQSPHPDRWNVHGPSVCRVAIEAGVRWGWDAVIGPDGIFIGMLRFGSSGRYQDLYRYFNITAEYTVERVMAYLEHLDVRLNQPNI
jgi:transketolase